jgi:hypothetical protein
MMSDTAQERPPHLYVRSVNVRIPGLLGLVLALPLLLVFGAVALTSLLVALAASVFVPRLLRGSPRHLDAGAPDAPDTITLERSAYRRTGESDRPGTRLLRGPSPDTPSTRQR